MKVVDTVAMRLGRPARLRAATPVRLADLLAFAKGHVANRTTGRRLVHEEVTLRLAYQTARMEDLGREERLRPSCRTNLASICQRLRHSLDELRSTPAAQREEPAHHLELFCRLKERHVNDLPVLARAFRNLCEGLDHEHTNAAPIDAQLDAYFTASLGVNVLIDQSVFVERDGAGRALPGIVEEACDLGAIAQDAAEISRELCERALGDAPECTLELLGDGTPRVPGIPHLFHAALLEILKNAVRATTLRARAERTELAPVRVRVVSGTEDVIVLIDDGPYGRDASARTRAPRARGPRVVAETARADPLPSTPPPPPLPRPALPQSAVVSCGAGRTACSLATAARRPPRRSPRTTSARASAAIATATSGRRGRRRRSQALASASPTRARSCASSAGT
jgi:hypothetical protein